MIAHVIENGVVVNTISVSSLDALPNLISGEVGAIGWLYDGANLIDPNPPTPEQIAEQQNAANIMTAEQIRSQRNMLLAETDWMALSDVTLTAGMAAYRQALRDVPNQAGFPYNVTWPIKPE